MPFLHCWTTAQDPYFFISQRTLETKCSIGRTPYFATEGILPDDVQHDPDMCDLLASLKYLRANYIHMSPEQSLYESLSNLISLRVSLQDLSSQNCACQVPRLAAPDSGEATAWATRAGASFSRSCEVETGFQQVSIPTRFALFINRRVQQVGDPEGLY